MSDNNTTVMRYGIWPPPEGITFRPLRKENFMIDTDKTRIDNIDTRINILDQRLNDLTEEVSWLRQHYQNMLEEIVQLRIAVNKLNQRR